MLRSRNVTFEVMGLEVGILRMRDLRDAARGLRAGHRVGVLVLGACGEPPFVGPVTITTKRSGHSEHPALRCDSCGKPRHVLYLRAGVLGCATCARRRTRRQAERTLATWRMGGREEDRLLRMVGRGYPLAVLSALADEITEGDADRAAVAVDAFRTAAMCMESLE